MHVQGSIVSSITSDGVKLHGFYSRSREPNAQTWILVHGVNSSFYGSSLLMDLAGELSRHGCSVLIVNTRGHDLCSYTTTPVPRRIGSMFERIHESLHDLQCWIDFAALEGGGSVSLLGHSLGAIKSAFYAANVVGKIKSMIAISPPRLNTALLLSDQRKASVFQEHLARARDYCESHEPDKVMRVRFPLPNWVSASTFLDKYGSSDRYDYLTFLPKIETPTFWIFGETEVAEGSANFRSADRQLQDSIQRLPVALAKLHSLSVIRNGDHNYQTTRLELNAAISNYVVSQH